MNGWIKLHRKLMTSNIFQNEKLLKIFIYCLMKATHTDRDQMVGKQKVELKPGQFVFGRKKAALELDMKESTVRDYINILKSDNVIEVTSTNKFSVISVVNWEVYQSSEDDDHQQNDSTMTTEGQQNDTNKNVKNLRIKELGCSSSMDDSAFAGVMEFYQGNLQKGITESPYNHSLLIQWFDEWGSELLLSAMKLAAKQEAKGVAFLEGVLKNWKEAGVQNIEDARRYETEFRNRHKKPTKNNVVQIGRRENQYDQHNYGF